MRPLILLMAGLAAMTAACTSDGSPSDAGNEPDQSAQAASQVALDRIRPALRPIVDPVVADAAARLAVEPSSVAVVSVEATTWPDGALGCPEDGMFYTQALVDGHRVVVNVQGSTLDYRVTGPGAFRLCTNGESPAP